MQRTEGVTYLLQALQMAQDVPIAAVAVHNTNGVAFLHPVFHVGDQAWMLQALELQCRGPRPYLVLLIDKSTSMHSSAWDNKVVGTPRTSVRPTTKNNRESSAQPRVSKQAIKEPSVQPRTKCTTNKLNSRQAYEDRVCLLSQIYVASVDAVLEQYYSGLVRFRVPRIAY